jgi:glyoxylase-like metal-dependent hydrolase (beta-lactamase superfamily II)
VSTDLRNWEISAGQLARRLESGEALQVVDVRAPARVAAGRIDLVPSGAFHNIPGSRLLELGSLQDAGLDAGMPAVTVCGHGNDSQAAAAHLRRLGCDAVSLNGGMAAWMNLVLPRELAPTPSLDRFIQFDRVGKGALGYLLVSSGEALIVDPPRRHEAYLEAAERAGATVVGVADTHVHADYISGAAALAAELDVPYHLHAADSRYPYDGTPGRLRFHPLRDRDTIQVGQCRVVARHTPGHTEGSLTFLVEDAAALTGDFLFVGSVGRPDLAGKSEQWTAQLWASLEAALREWPAAIMVYPAHYGSEAERRADRAVGAPLGELLRANEALRLGNAAAFARWVASRVGSFPEAYRRIKAVNVGLVEVGEREAEELDVGRNECALGGGASGRGAAQT